MYIYFCGFLLFYYLYNKAINIYSFINNSYIYNQSWEDPDIDKKLYDLKDNNNILMITTGGDNVLNYLLNNPISIDTIDFNKHQNYLLQMKMALIKSLSWNDCFDILAYSDYNKFLNNFHIISQYLTPSAKLWWIKNKYIMKNFHYSGYVQYFYYFIKFYIYILGLQTYINKLKNADFNTQQKLYIENKNRLNILANILYYFSNYLCPFIGVPQAQAELSDLHPREWLYRILYKKPFQNNYFYYSYLYGHWTIDCCPDYLKYNNYSIIKNNLHKISIYTDNIENIYKYKNIIYSKYDRVILLDHMDWMNNTEIIKELNSIIPYTTNDCKFCWKSFSFKQPFACLNNISYDVSSVIFPFYQDRVGMYNSIHVASINKLPTIDIPIYNISSFNRIKIFLYTIFIPLLNLFQKNKKKFMDNYYKYQAKYYDAYRLKLLHGKLPLLYSINYKVSDVLILAGGTGDIIEYIKPYINNFNKITIVDISQPMIDEAILKVKKYNLKNVECICQNALDIDTTKQYDLIIISYSLTMIPEWSNVIDITYKILKNKGQLAVADFCFDESQYYITKLLFNFIFYFSYININPLHLVYLQSKFDTKFIRIQKGDFPYILGIKCPYYYGIFIKNIDND